MARDWVRGTLGDAAHTGHPITVWCNDRACGYWLTRGEQHRTTLSVADLAWFAETYGADLEFGTFRRRLRCQHCGSGDVSTIVEQSYETPAERQKRLGC